MVINEVVDTPVGGVTEQTRAVVESVWEAGERHRIVRNLARQEPPLVRLWDGDWGYIGAVHDAIEASFEWKLNDTGAGHVVVPADSWLAKRVMDFRGRQARGIHITMDKDGARWGGRLNNVTVSKTSDGQRIVDMNFLHDYEEVKHVFVWPNPHLPAAVQFPRAFTLVGPTAWVLKTALLLNVRRLAGNVWALPDDPFDPSQWGAINQPSSWPIHVAPTGSLGQDSSPWTVISSRMKNWHDLAAPKLADAQLSVTARRWLEGDPPPWPGGVVAHGSLVIDIEDKSGFWSADGTATSGSIWGGLTRTVQAVLGEDSHSETVIPEPVEVPEYSAPATLSTTPSAPYVIYRDGQITGVEASDFTWHPATDIQVVVGGHSMPGVNEAISASVILIGNYLGAIFLNFSAGSIADKFLAPLYEDTILAWQSIKSTSRAQELGWSHYYEHFSDGADKAYTLSSVLALRQGFWETRERVSHKLKVADGAPWFIGDRGQGHFFLGDRIGSTIDGLPSGQVVVEQVTNLVYAFDRGARGWEATCGDPASQQSPLERVLDKVRDALGAIHDLGVLG